MHMHICACTHTHLYQSFNILVSYVLGKIYKVHKLTCICKGIRIHIYKCTFTSVLVTELTVHRILFSSVGI